MEVGNVTFLDGNPPPDVLRGVASAYIEDAALNAAKTRFNAMLAAHGRPHGDHHVTTYYGMSLVELLSGGGGVLRRAPWFGNEGGFVVLEAHGHEIDGWWMQASHDVMLHVHFGRGLTVEETARILSGSPTPAADLVAYLRSHIDDERLCSNESVVSLLPSDLRKHLDASFQCGHRVARLLEWSGHGGVDRVFGLTESYTWKCCREIDE